MEHNLTIPVVTLSVGWIPSCVVCGCVTGHKSGIAQRIQEL